VKARTRTGEKRSKERHLGGSKKSWEKELEKISGKPPGTGKKGFTGWFSIGEKRGEAVGQRGRVGHV